MSNALKTYSVDFAVALKHNHRPLTVDAGVQYWVNARGICGGQSGNLTGFPPSTSVTPVSIIPPMLHTQSFIYHQRCIMFFSQYFSYPCQYHSTNAPYSIIHLSPTLYNVFLPVLHFPRSVSFHQYSILIHSSITEAV